MLQYKIFGIVNDMLKPKVHFHNQNQSFFRSLW